MRKAGYSVPISGAGSRKMWPCRRACLIPFRE